MPAGERCALILFLASWDAPGSMSDESLARVVSDVSRLFPPLAGAAVGTSGWDAQARVAWLSAPSLNADIAVSSDRLSIVEGFAVRHDARVLAAADLPGATSAVLDDLDGQYVVLDASRDHLTVRTDLLGLRPVYWARHGDTWLVANRVELIARAIGGATFDVESAARFLSVGWVTGDRTLATGVLAVPGGQHWTWHGTTVEQRSVHHPSALADRARGHGPRVEELADALVRGCRGVADTAATVDAPLTAGLDSRLVMALLRCGGVDAQYFTTGSEDSEDVRTGRAIATMTHVPYVVREIDGAGLISTWPDVARATVAQNDGLVSLWQAADSLAVRPRGVHLSGIGGEVARGHFTRPTHFVPQGRGRAVQRFVAERATNPAGLLTAEAVESGRAALRTAAAQAIEWGFGHVDLGDALYTFGRLPRWAGANQRKVPDSTQYAPLATRPFVEAAFSLSSARRYSEPLHFALLSRLAPDLHSFPVAGGGWRSQVPYVNFAQKALRRARPSSPTGTAGPQVAWLETLRPALAARCLDDATSPIWDVVDRTVFETIMLDAAATAQRQRAAEAVFGVVTMFEYAALRQPSRS